MPYAARADTAHHWATDRATDLWACFADDLDEQDLADLVAAAAAIQADGGRLAVVGRHGAALSSAEAQVAHVRAAGPPAPSPFGLFAALEAAGVEDARRLGVLGASAAALEAGHRAGAGAVVGIGRDGAKRRALLPAQPDALVAATGFGWLYHERYGSRRAHRQRVLLNPGPCVVSDRVHRAIGGPDLCHREPECADLIDRLHDKLLEAAEVDGTWTVALLGGSGTAAVEAMVGAGARPGRALLVCRNGHYGDRMAEMARRHGTEVVTVDAPATEPISSEAVAAALEHHPEVDAVAVVHHETTTGLLNPVHEIAAAASARGVLTMVDAVSALGAEELRLDGSGIDFVACTVNKCLHSLPGVSFVLLSPAAQARAAEAPSRSLYFDLQAYITAQARRTVPFTPAVPALYALDAALDELLEEGVKARRLAYAARMAHLDGAMTHLGFEPLVASPHRSRSVRTYWLPEGVPYARLHDAVKADGYVIYAGLGAAAERTFRVCALGAITEEALDGFVASLAAALPGNGG